GTILDNTAKISISDAAALEPELGKVGFMLFQLVLSTPSAGSVTADLILENETARAGEDFTAVSGDSVRFAPGETLLLLGVQINSRPFEGLAKHFYVTLANAKGAGLSRARGIGTIVNNRPTPVTPPKTTNSPAIVRNDLNRDGIPDLLFQDASGNLAVW